MCTVPLIDLQDVSFAYTGAASSALPGVAPAVSGVSLAIEAGGTERDLPRDQHPGPARGRAEDCGACASCGDGTCQAFETATTCEADCKTDQEKCPLADSTGQEACEGIAQQVQAQCTAGGGNVTGWEITAGDCMTSYQCWVGCSPCVMYCSVKCGNDAQCGQDCLNEFGIDQTQAAEQCSGCGVPQVKALCEYPP